MSTYFKIPLLQHLVQRWFAQLGGATLGAVPLGSPPHNVSHLLVTAPRAALTPGPRGEVAGRSREGEPAERHKEMKHHPQPESAAPASSPALTTVYFSEMEPAQQGGLLPLSPLLDLFFQ